MSLNCDISIRVNASNTVEESPTNNFEIKCNKKAEYAVKPKGVENIVFFCCQKHSKLFSHMEYNFTRI